LVSAGNSRRRKNKNAKGGKKVKESKVQGGKKSDKGGGKRKSKVSGAGQLEGE